MWKSHRVSYVPATWGSFHRIQMDLRFFSIFPGWWFGIELAMIASYPPTNIEPAIYTAWKTILSLWDRAITKVYVGGMLIWRSQLVLLHKECRTGRTPISGSFKPIENNPQTGRENAAKRVPQIKPFIWNQQWAATTASTSSSAPTSTSTTSTTTTTTTATTTATLTSTTTSTWITPIATATAHYATTTARLRYRTPHYIQKW